MTEHEPMQVTVMFDMKVLTTLPQFAGMTTRREIADAIQVDFNGDFGCLMDHMADYPLFITVEPINGND